MKTVLLFDCDGVIADTRKANYRAYLNSLATHTNTGDIHSTFTFEAFKKVWGQSWKRWLPDLAPGQAEAVHRLKTKAYPYYLENYAELLCGFDLIRYWQARQVPLAIVSNASESSLKHLFNWIKKKSHVPYADTIRVITPGKHLPPKPHPLIFKETLAIFNADRGILIDDDLLIGTESAALPQIDFIHYEKNEFAFMNDKIKRAYNAK